MSILKQKLFKEEFLTKNKDIFDMKNPYIMESYPVIMEVLSLINMKEQDYDPLALTKAYFKDKSITVLYSIDIFNIFSVIDTNLLGVMFEFLGLRNLFFEILLYEYSLSEKMQVIIREIFIRNLICVKRIEDFFYLDQIVENSSFIQKN